jgi:hypothetical protein
MLSVIACACGMDPGTEGMLVQVAMTGALSLPFILRKQAYQLVRRLRGKADTPQGSCQLAGDADPGA